MTTTIELIERQLAVAESRIGEGKELFLETAQRLRELDKPDCVWTATKVAELDCFKPACTNAVMYFDLEKKHYCPKCGGAIKELLS